MIKLFTNAMNVCGNCKETQRLLTSRKKILTKYTLFSLENRNRVIVRDIIE